MTAPRFALLKSYSFFIFFPLHRRGFSCRNDSASVIAKRIDFRYYTARKTLPGTIISGFGWVSFFAQSKCIDIFKDTDRVGEIYLVLLQVRRGFVSVPTKSHRFQCMHNLCTNQVPDEMPLTPTVKREFPHRMYPSGAKDTWKIQSCGISGMRILT